MYNSNQDLDRVSQVYLHGLFAIYSWDLSL